MKNRFAFVLLTFVAVAPAWAVNKCTINGKVVYQDAPCDAQSQKSEEMKTLGVHAAPAAAGGKPLQYKLQPLLGERAATVANEATALAKASMKDPDSVQLRNVKVLSFEALGRGFLMTCGEINAKNSYGGYVGFKDFWVYDGIFTQTFDHYLPSSKATNWLMGKPQTECLRNGVAPST